MSKYRLRLAEKILDSKLASSGAVLVVGPKWCGKTTLAKRRAKSFVNVDVPENLQLAEFAMEDLLQGRTPLLLDEWQWAPQLWDGVRRCVDDRGKMGQFILTGSAVPNDSDAIKHTGTGRFSWLNLRTMSLFETGDSKGQISLEELFSAPDKIYAKNPIDFARMAYLLCRGGWPGSLGLDENAALQIPYNYYDGLIRSDMSRVDGIKRNPDRVSRLLRSLARNQGTQASVQLICSDMQTNDEKSLDNNTVFKYVEALKRLYVEDDLPAWNPNLRSKTAIRTSDTRYLADPSIAVAALGVGPSDLMTDLHSFGFLFETMCVRDLRVYAEVLNGNVYHYRDSSGLECDAVIHLRNGQYGLVEIKLGGEKAIDEGVKCLKKLAGNIDLQKMPPPSFLMVLIGVGKFAYRRDDGVYVVPVGCLR